MSTTLIADLRVFIVQHGMTMIYVAHLTVWGLVAHLGFHLSIGSWTRLTPTSLGLLSVVAIIPLGGLHLLRFTDIPVVSQPASLWGTHTRGAPTPTSTLYMGGPQPHTPVGATLTQPPLVDITTTHSAHQVNYTQPVSRQSWCTLQTILCHIPPVLFPKCLWLGGEGGYLLATQAAVHSHLTGTCDLLTGSTLISSDRDSESTLCPGQYTGPHHTLLGQGTVPLSPQSTFYTCT